jgi:hypothetical protein
MVDPHALKDYRGYVVGSMLGALVGELGTDRKWDERVRLIADLFSRSTNADVLLGNPTSYHVFAYGRRPIPQDIVDRMLAAPASVPSLLLLAADSSSFQRLGRSVVPVSTIARHGEWLPPEVWS